MTQNAFHDCTQQRKRHCVTYEKIMRWNYTELYGTMNVRELSNKDIS